MPIDLHVIPPSNLPPGPGHPHGAAFFTIVTTGLSSRPMNLPPGATSSPYAELMIALPMIWPGMKMDGTFDLNVMRDEKNWWPMRLLKAIARLVHDQNTCLGPGHTIPNGPAASPYMPDTQLACMMVMPSALHPGSFRLPVNDTMTIEFYALWPIYREELLLRQEKGVNPLLSLFGPAGITELLQLARKNVVTGQ